MTSIPTQLMDGTFITALDLSQNQLTELPNWFCDTLVSLGTLNLSHNFFFDLPEKLSELKRLRELDISYNKLEFIPSSVLSLMSLITLDVSHNTIVVVPPDIYRLKNTLTELNVSYNALLELPEELKAMRKLRFAKWSENNLFYHTIMNVTSKLSVEEPKPKVLPPNYKRQRSASNILAPRASLSTDIPREVLEEAHPQHMPPRMLLLLELLESERKYLRYMNIFHEL